MRRSCRAASWLEDVWRIARCVQHHRLSVLLRNLLQAEMDAEQGQLGLLPLHKRCLLVRGIEWLLLSV